MYSPETINTIIHVMIMCVATNFGCSGLMWFRGNYGFSKFCAVMGMFCVGCIIGIKYCYANNI